MAVELVFNFVSQIFVAKLILEEWLQYFEIIFENIFKFTFNFQFIFTECDFFRQILEFVMWI